MVIIVFVALTMYTQEYQYIFWRILELGWTSIPLKGEGKGRTTPSRLMLGKLEINKKNINNKFNV